MSLHALPAEANVDLSGNAAALGNYLTVSDQGTDVVVDFDPTGRGGGSAIAVLQSLGTVVTGLETLITRGAIRIM